LPYNADTLPLRPKVGNQQAGVNNCLANCRNQLLGPGARNELAGQKSRRRPPMIEWFIHHPEFYSTRCQRLGEPIEPVVPQLHKSAEADNA
jgi:hypothetical protein